VNITNAVHFLLFYTSFLSAMPSLKKMHYSIVETEDFKQTLKIARQL